MKKHHIPILFSLDNYSCVWFNNYLCSVYYTNNKLYDIIFNSVIYYGETVYHDIS